MAKLLWVQAKVRRMGANTARLSAIVSLAGGCDRFNGGGVTGASGDAGDARSTIRRLPLASASVSATAAVSVTAAASATDAVPLSSAASEMAESAGESATVQVGAFRTHSPAKANERIHVPAGNFHAGSFPGEEGRDPRIEATAFRTEVAAFEIDALPYPGDLSKPARVNVPHAEAEKLCADRGARLCTEVEWERACRGPDDAPFSTGAHWDKTCEKDGASCTSGFGIRMMGSVREWTQSRIESNAPGENARGFAIKGSTPLSAVYRFQDGSHRCGRRAVGGESLAVDSLGFRCCKGPETNATYVPSVLKNPAFSKKKMTSAELATMFASVPELARLKGDIRLNELGDAHVIETKGDTPTRGYILTTEPLLWNPEAGSELVVVTGKAKNASFIVALYPIEGERARIASYFLMLGDVMPVALAYHPERRGEILWTTCFGCYGDHGRMSVREDHRVVIVQDASNTKDEAAK